MKTVYDIQDHVLVRHFSSQKEWVIAGKEGKFLLPDAEILVYRKQKFHRLPVAQIGDGMKIVVLYPQQAPEKILSSAVEAGLTVYQEYDEEMDVWRAYLYKYAGGDAGRAILNQYLHELGSELSVREERKFTRVVGEVIRTLPTYEQYDELISFLVGVALGYGKPKQMIDDRLVSWHIGLPLVGSLVESYTVLEHVLDKLTEYGIYTVRSLQAQGMGSLVQITIHDPVMVGILERIWIGKQHSVPRGDHLMAQLKTMLGADERLHNSVLKFISK